VKRTLSIGFSIALVAGALAIGYLRFSSNGQSHAEDAASVSKTGSSSEVEAPVKVAPIRQGAVTEEITVYGTVVPAAGAVQTVSVPFESRVRRILVSESQRVSQGDLLLEIEPSADAKLQTDLARNEFESAQKAFDFLQQRFDLKLATNDQLLQGKQALEQAREKLESLRRRELDGTRAVHAGVQGLISKISAQEGAIVPAGSSMIEMVAQNRLEVRLGIEPENVDKVKLGQAVSLARVNAPAAKTVSGLIRKISHAADPTTRLVQVFTAPPANANFLLGEFVAGKIAIASERGLIVPRSAVLPEEDHFILFTTKEGRAQEHQVHVGLQDQNETEVIADDLRPGDLVVTLGNYELKDGMAVKVDGSR